MPKFKTIVEYVEAIQFIGLDRNKYDIVEFFKGSKFYMEFNYSNDTIDVETKYGALTVFPSDYIIKNNLGEFSIMNNLEFSKKYEASNV